VAYLSAGVTYLNTKSVSWSTLFDNACPVVYLIWLRYVSSDVPFFDYATCWLVYLSRLR